MDRSAFLARDLLIKARQRVEAGWCQGTAARGPSGKSVLPDDPAATSWSASGAIIAAVCTDPTIGAEALRQAPFALAMNALSTVVDAGPQSWNDKPDRAQSEVVAALTAALQHLLVSFPRAVERRTHSSARG